MSNPYATPSSCRARPSRPVQGGFTVIELMIGIAVLAILTALAVPAFTQFVQNNRLAGQANELVSAFQFARSEALKRGSNVRICPSADGENCGGAWTDGWIATMGSGELRVWPSPGDGFQITGGGSVEFDESGASTTLAEQRLSLMLDGCTNDNARDIVIEPTGRVASERVECP